MDTISKSPVVQVPTQATVRLTKRHVPSGKKMDDAFTSTGATLGGFKRATANNVSSEKH